MNNLHVSVRQVVKLSGDSDFELRLKQWAAKQEVCCILQSNSAQQLQVDPYAKFEWCVAAGTASSLTPATSSFDSLRNHHQSVKDWLFGFFTYDLKNELEALTSKNYDELNFPGCHFFQPEWVFIKDESGIRQEYVHDPADIQNVASEYYAAKEIYPVARQDKADYIRQVEAIKQHIYAGDIFEMNYCMEFFAKHQLDSPLSLYERLNEISPMPFSCFYKLHDKFLVCASPERFLAKREKNIISQPIKGTAHRGLTQQEDETIRQLLLNDKKEKAENVMIVDLVRNDLSKTAVKGSVRVEELSALHTFKRVHQLVSTITSELSDEYHWTDAIKHAFPMGSMTGVPKVRAMQLIEQYEKARRGLYSGSVGYVTPEGDFDFNVIIRSILYNASRQYLSLMAGSAITSDCLPDKEYKECLLKAETMLKALRRKS